MGMWLEVHFDGPQRMQDIHMPDTSGVEWRMMQMQTPADQRKRLKTLGVQWTGIVLLI